MGDAEMAQLDGAATGRGESVGVVTRYLQAVADFDAEAVAQLLDPAAVQVEMPNLLNPKGQTRGAAQMLADLPRGAALLSQQSYVIGSVVAEDRQVAVAAEWQGTLKVPVGGLAAGATMQAHIAMHFEVSDGRIVRQVNCDCYEPFER